MGKIVIIVTIVIITVARILTPVRVPLLYSYYLGEPKITESYRVSQCHVLSHFSCVQLFAAPWTVACQAPLSMGFSRQAHWSGLPLFHSPGDLPDPEIEPCLLHHMKILYHLSHQGRSSILHIYKIKSL